MWFVTDMCRHIIRGTTSKTSKIRKDCEPTVESASGRFLRRVGDTVGKPVLISKYPPSSLAHTGAHRSFQQGMNRNDSS